MTDRMIAFVSALSIHGALLFGGQAFFVQPVEYGVEAGVGGVEITLVAAPRAESSGAVVEKTELSEESLLNPEPQPLETKPEPLKGDGSSPVPGRDATTLSSIAGAYTEAKPGYLKNPAPRYPEQARRRGQEGVVILWVYVSAEGRAARVEIKQSSGYPLLDQAALEAVGRWQFQPAKVASIAIDCIVEVPVRFELE